MDDNDDDDDDDDDHVTSMLHDVTRTVSNVAQRSLVDNNETGTSALGQRGRTIRWPRRGTAIVNRNRINARKQDMTDRRTDTRPLFYAFRCMDAASVKSTSVRGDVI